jgi:hypothetical protein
MMEWIGMLCANTITTKITVLDWDSEVVIETGLWPE